MEAIGNLTGGMAHDFNNLLAVVVGNLDLLTERKNLDGKSEELAVQALEAALRGADLIRGLLAFARRQPLMPQLIDVNELVARISRLLQRTLVENIELTLVRGEGVWPILESETVDLLFTDIVMPSGMSGYDLARTVVSRWPSIKVVLTSGFPEAKLNGDDRRPSNMRLLTKPYRKADLARTLREVLDA